MTESTWQGFKRIDFTFLGREAWLVFPKKPNGKGNWIFKTEYFDDFPDFQIKMLEAGWHLAFVKNKNRWGLEEDFEIKIEFIKHVSKSFNLSPKCVLEGMSLGGMFAVKLAAKYPEGVSAIYLDAPVMNFLSCPAGLGVASNHIWDEFTEATGMTLVDLISYRDNPIDKMHLLYQNDIPIVMVYGDSDEVVPYSENGALLEKYYESVGGTIRTFGKVGCGHHPHGLEDNGPIIDFIMKYGT